MNDATRVNAEIWERLYSQGLTIAYPNDVFVRVTHRLFDIRRHPRLLDYGCGSCQNLAHLLSRGFDVRGVDVSPSALTAGAALLQGKGLSAELKLIHEGQLDYPDGFFDGVVAWGVLEYNDWPGLRRATSEIDRVLRPGGVFLGAVNAPGDFKHRNSVPLGDGLVMLNESTGGQEHARVLIVEEHDLPRVFPAHALTVGHYEHSFGPTYARHWIVSYEKAS